MLKKIIVSIALVVSVATWASAEVIEPSLKIPGATSLIIVSIGFHRKG